MDQDYILKKIEKYADEKGIPIMEKEGIEFLTEFIRLNKIKNVLELGSAIGYSAIKMALADDNVYVTTVERDKDRYIEAVKNIKKMGLDDRITLIFADAFDFDTTEKFDLIFIDAAKSQYTKFFEKFSKNLKDDGFIVTDNIKFHGLAFSDKSKLSRNLRQLLGKLERYVEFLKNNLTFKTRFFDIGDGIAISKRRKKNNEENNTKNK